MAAFSTFAFHNIVEIKVDCVHKLVQTGSNVRHIIFKDKDGNEFHVSAFSINAAALNLEVTREPEVETV
jgi:hypothetical protein